MSVLDRCYNIADMREFARRRLPKGVFEYLDRGAEDEIALADNREAFKRMKLRTRFLVGLTERDMGTELLGKRAELPLAIAPTGSAGLTWYQGELELAKAAAAKGVPFTLATGSITSMEKIAEIAGGRLWFQLYMWKSEEVVRSLVARAKAAGYEALVVTVDVPVVGKRERDLRNGMSLPVRVRPRSVVDASLHLPWLWRMLNGPDITFASLAGLADGDDASSIGEYADRELTDPTRTWDDLLSLRRAWDGPLLVKGVMTPADARAAVDSGVDGIIVSNHGGRQLDGSRAPFDQLQAIVDAVGGEIEIILDGGIRRGTHVLKALAMGATACSGGRMYLYALAGAGEAGVERAMSKLHDEIERDMMLMGCKSISELDRSKIAARP